MKRKNVRRRALCLENLERRTVLSTAALLDGTLHIEGDSGDNTIQVGFDAEGQVAVTLDGGEPQTFDPAEIEAIDIDAGRGHDTISVDLPEWAIEAGESFTVNGKPLKKLIRHDSQLPTSPVLTSLTWRFQLPKGLSPQKRGVTNFQFV